MYSPRLLTLSGQDTVLHVWWMFYILSFIKIPSAVTEMREIHICHMLLL